MYQQTVNNDNVIVVQTGLFQQDLLASLPFQKTHAISLSPHQIQLLCYCWKCNQSYSCFPNIVLIISLTAVLDAGFERHGNHLIFFLNMEKKKKSVIFGLLWFGWANQGLKWQTLWPILENSSCRQSKLWVVWRTNREQRPSKSFWL